MIIIYFQKHHSLTATRTFERVIAEGMQYAITPAVEGQNDFMLFSVNGGIKIFVPLFVHRDHSSGFVLKCFSGMCWMKC